MKKIIPLFLALSFISTINAQRKIELPKLEPARIEYVNIQEILDHKGELELTDIQTQSFIVKNEYIKRDMRDLNKKTNLERIEKKMYQKELNNSYQLFIERQLTNSQLEKWMEIKRQIDLSNEQEKTFKGDLEILHKLYAEEVKDLQIKYSADKKMYLSQKKSLANYYNIKAHKIQQYYNEKALAAELGEEETVMTLEEIANLVKDFEETTSASSPLNYINIDGDEEEMQEEVIPE